jgi:hypothetical protein
MTSCAFRLEDGSHLLREADLLASVQIVIILGFLGCVLRSWRKGEQQHTTKAPRTQRSESTKLREFGFGNLCCTRLTYRQRFLFHRASQHHLRDLCVLVVPFSAGSMIKKKLSAGHDGPGDIVKGFFLRFWFTTGGGCSDGF